MKTVKCQLIGPVLFTLYTQKTENGFIKMVLCGISFKFGTLSVKKKEKI